MDLGIAYFNSTLVSRIVAIINFYTYAPGDPDSGKILVVVCFFIFFISYL